MHAMCLLSETLARCIELVFFFFNDTATTEIYTLSLHDALPISEPSRSRPRIAPARARAALLSLRSFRAAYRSEEHTSELQSQSNLVCRLLLEKKKTLPRHVHAAPLLLPTPASRSTLTHSRPPRY